MRWRRRRTARDAHNLVGICLDAPRQRRTARRRPSATRWRSTRSTRSPRTTSRRRRWIADGSSGRQGCSAARSAATPQQKQVRDNLDTVLLLLGRRVMWSLFAAAVVLGILLVTERAVVDAGARGSGVRRRGGACWCGTWSRDLPRGVGRWGRGMFRRAQLAGQVPPRTAGAAVGRCGAAAGLRAVSPSPSGAGIVAGPASCARSASSAWSAGSLMARRQPRSRHAETARL